MIPYPTETMLRAKDLHRELRATGRFNALRLKDIEESVAWTVLVTMWESKRCASFRAEYDVAGFVAWYVADIGRRRYCIPDPSKGCVSNRLARLVKRAGVAPTSKQAKAAAGRSATETAIEALVASAHHVTLDDGSTRIVLDASIILGGLLADRSTFISFAFEERTVTLSRAKLVDVARAMRAMTDVRCYFHLDANVPQLRFWWGGGRGGLNFSHPFSFVEWNMKVHAAETTAVVFPVPCRYTPVEPATVVVEAVAVEPLPVVEAVPEIVENAPPVSVTRVRKACPVCSHPMRVAIDLTLAEGAAPASLCATLGIDSYTARVHARDHLSAPMASARRAARNRMAA